MSPAGSSGGAPPPGDGVVLAPRRLHPASVVLGAWKAVLLLSAVFLRPVLDGQGGWVTDLAGSAGAGRSPRGIALAGLLAFLVVVVAGILLSILPWAVRRFGADGHELVVSSGVLNRRRRHVRLDRIQAVDIDEPLVARLFGLAVLRLTMAAGDEASIRLAYLSLDDAVALRNRFLAGAAGLAADTPQAPERVLAAVTAGTAAGALLLSGATIGLVLAGVAVLVAGIGYGAWYVLPSLVPLLLGLGAAAIRALNGTVGFTLAESPDGFRVRAGLLDRRSQTVPPGRIQGLRVRRPLLWRPLGWSRVDVDVAGLGGRDSDAGRNLSRRTDLVPVADRATAAAVCVRVLGVDPGAVELVGVPRRARWVDPLAAWVLGAGTTGHVVVARHGLLTPTVTAVPYAKVQSVRVTQGPLQRWLRLATVHVDSPKGPVELELPHRDLAEVPGLLADLLARARAARAEAGPDRWMSGPARPGAAEPVAADVSGRPDVAG